MAAGLDVITEGIQAMEAHQTATNELFACFTACKSNPPELFGGFHVLMTTLAIAAAMILSGVTASRAISHSDGTLLRDSRDASGIRPAASPSGYSSTIRNLHISGCILASMEIYKQLFLFFCVNGGHYNWWYFPFQLCSVPMYLCLLLPLMGQAAASVSLTFMATYSVVGAIAALAYPEDFLRQSISLSLHGFIWHGILLYIGLVIIRTGSSRIIEADFSRRGFLKSTYLFLLLCAAAVLINIASYPAAIADPAIHSHAVMFYLDPRFRSPQPLVGELQDAIGIPAGLLLYIAAIVAVSAITCLLIHLYENYKQSRQPEF